MLVIAFCHVLIWILIKATVPPTITGWTTVELQEACAGWTHGMSDASKRAVGHPQSQGRGARPRRIRCWPRCWCAYALAGQVVANSVRLFAEPADLVLYLNLLPRASCIASQTRLREWPLYVAKARWRLGLFTSRVSSSQGSMHTKTKTNGGGWDIH